MKKRIMKFKLRIERTLIAKIMKQKGEIKTLKELNEGLKKENHKLIDEITIKNLKIRELSLGVRNERIENEI